MPTVQQQWEGHNNYTMTVVGSCQLYNDSITVMPIIKRLWEAHSNYTTVVLSPANLQFLGYRDIHTQHGCPLPPWLTVPVT